MSFNRQIAIHKLDLKSSEQIVLLTIDRMIGDKGKCWPTRESLSSESGLSFATVKRAIASLRAKGYLLVSTRKEKGKQSSSEYEIDWTAVIRDGQSQGLKTGAQTEGQNRGSPGLNLTRSGAQIEPLCSYNENTNENTNRDEPRNEPLKNEPRKAPPADPWFRDDTLEDLIAKMKAVWDSTFKDRSFSILREQKTILNRHVAEYGADTVYATWQWLCTCDDEEEPRNIRKKWKGLRTFLKPENLCGYIQAHQEYLEGDVEGKRLMQSLKELTEKNRLEFAKVDARLAEIDKEDAEKKKVDPTHLNRLEHTDLCLKCCHYNSRREDKISLEDFIAHRPDIVEAKRLAEQREKELAACKPSPEDDAELEKLRRLMAKKEDKPC